MIVRKDQSGKTPFPETNQKALCDAVKLARDWAKYARCVFDEIWNEKGTRRKIKAWKNNAAISTYMGKKRLSREAIRKVRLRVQRISQKLSRWTVRFIYIQHMKGSRSYLCDTPTVPGGAYAYSSPSTGVKLCPLFFTDFKMTPETRAMTIIHELVHTLGWGIHYKIPGGKRVIHGFDLFANDLIDKKTEKLAEVRPWRARRNAGNYATMMYALFRQSGANPCPPK